MAGRGKGDSAKTTDEQAASVWVLKAEGRSLRAIAKETGLNVATVQRVLTKDPERLRALARALAEERARAWEGLLAGSIVRLDVQLSAVHGVMFTEKGRIRQRLPTPAEQFVITEGAKWAQANRHGANDAHRAIQLLTGQPTEHVYQQDSRAIEELSPEEIERYFVDNGLESMLPAAWRERRAKRQNERTRPTAPADRGP